MTLQDSMEEMRREKEEETNRRKTNRKKYADRMANLKQVEQEELFASERAPLLAAIERMRNLDPEEFDEQEGAIFVTKDRQLYDLRNKTGVKRVPGF